MQKAHNILIKSLKLRKPIINIKKNLFQKIDTSLYKILANNLL